MTGLPWSIHRRKLKRLYSFDGFSPFIGRTGRLCMRGRFSRVEGGLAFIRMERHAPFALATLNSREHFPLDASCSQSDRRGLMSVLIYLAAELRQYSPCSLRELARPFIT